jgi:predicted HTH transcriptional regulator
MNTDDYITLIDHLVNLGEREWIEFKVDNSNPDEIGKRLSALANGARLLSKECGYLVYGVQDKPTTVVGTGFQPRESRKGGEELEMWLSRMLEPRIDFRIAEFEYNDLPIVVFEIPAAKDRPVRFQNESYIRINSITKPLREYPDKERKIWSTSNQIPFEKRIALSNLTAEQVLDKLDVQSYFRLLKQPPPSTVDSALEKLSNQHLIHKHSTSYSITNLGAILFARQLSDFEELRRKAPRIIVYDGLAKFHTIREMTGEVGYACGFEGMIYRINSQLPANEHIGSVFREEVRLYPDKAIRELVANALIHQDFSVSGTGPTVEIYSDRIEITNPGAPVIDTLRFIDENQSRNERLAFLMRLAHICEEKGSGIDKTLNEIELYQLPPLDIIETEKHTKVILFAPRPLDEMDKAEKIRAAYQHCCLQYVMQKKMTNQTLRKRFQIPDEAYSTATRIINDTMSANLIKYDDPYNTSRKHARYVPSWS